MNRDIKYGTTPIRSIMFIPALINLKNRHVQWKVIFPLFINIKSTFIFQLDLYFDKHFYLHFWGAAMYRMMYSKVNQPTKIASAIPNTKCSSWSPIDMPDASLDDSLVDFSFCFKNRKRERLLFRLFRFRLLFTNRRFHFIFRH